MTIFVFKSEEKLIGSPTLKCTLVDFKVQFVIVKKFTTLGLSVGFFSICDAQ